MTMQNKHILLGVSGGIAAYKSAELLRGLQQQGAHVRVVMTESATKFITPLTFQALSGQPVCIRDEGIFDAAGMDHIALARWADLVLIAPATANTLAKVAQGIADDLLTSICLAHEKRLALAPAMNQAMWHNAATQDNIAMLQKREISILGPASGEQACGETGPGRMLEPDQIISQCEHLFSSDLLHGKRVLITAGPTLEAIDPVRFISNRSSGKMGYALATMAYAAGAQVTVVCGPNHCDEHEHIEYVHIKSAQQMHAEVMQRANQADLFIAAAAVADYRPVNTSEHKIKKQQDELSIQLIRNPDILHDVKQAHPNLFCVGFAAETEHLVKNARAKLDKKVLDMVIANNVALEDQGFDSDYNAVEVITQNGQQSLGRMSKSILAAILIDIISNEFNHKQQQSNVTVFPKQQN